MASHAPALAAGQSLLGGCQVPDDPAELRCDDPAGERCCTSGMTGPSSTIHPSPTPLGDRDLGDQVWSREENNPPTPCGSWRVDPLSSSEYLKILPYPSPTPSWRPGWTGWRFVRVCLGPVWAIFWSSSVSKFYKKCKSARNWSFLRAMRLSRPVLCTVFRALSFEDGPRPWFGVL